jgi:PAS domain S-box-containing protein
VRYDVTVRLAEKRFITIDFMLAPTFDARGRVEFLIPSGIDVTARNELTERLRAQQHRLEAILNSVPGIVYEGVGAADSETQKMAFISRYAEEMLGYPMEAWAASPNLWRQVVHPDDWEHASRIANETYEKRLNVPVPFRCVTKDGRIVHVESYNNVITDLNGNVVGTCGIVLDVTRRHQQQAEINRLTTLINRERQRLATIIGNVPGIVFESSVSTENGQPTMDFISAYIETLLGYTVDEAMADGFWQTVLHPDDWDRMIREMEALFLSQQSGKLQFRCIHKNGQIVHLETHSTILTDAHNTPIGVVGVMSDITERRQTEEALAHYADELRRSNEELEQFAYVASHDLQEPLRMVTSYLQLIEKRYSDLLDDDGREFIDFAVDGATRMKTLINDVLAYSRIQRGRVEPEPVQMNAILEQALHNLQLTIEDTDAVIAYDPLPQITANRAQMVQLLQNLIGNAIKFRSERRPEIHVGVKREGRMWHFTVQDNGIGIAQEYFERIFIIFQRLHTRGQYPGTGIGLAICRKIVDKHGGQIYAESVPNEGTTIHFTLPVEREERRYGRTVDGSN